MEPHSCVKGGCGSDFAVFFVPVELTIFMEEAIIFLPINRRSKGGAGDYGL